MHWLSLPCQGERVAFYSKALYFSQMRPLKRPEQLKTSTQTIEELYNDPYFKRGVNSFFTPVKYNMDTLTVNEQWNYERGRFFAIIIKPTLAKLKKPYKYARRDHSSLLLRELENAHNRNWIT